jgi:hypothetical protein
MFTKAKACTLFQPHESGPYSLSRSFCYNFDVILLKIDLLLTYPNKFLDMLFSLFLRGTYFTNLVCKM